MCGIAGASLSPNSKVNARSLAHYLLAEITWRGNQAAGYAYVAGGNKVGYYKNDDPGTQLKLKGLPRESKTFILHTRMATHGSTQYNENNHPVISSNNKTALVHNGVIWNHDMLRYADFDDVELPEVDSSVLSEIASRYGYKGFDKVQGDAAVAWLTSGEGNTLNLARIESSPVAYTWLTDGSFVFASTQVLLENALRAMGLEYGAVWLMSELDYYVIQNGIIMARMDVPKNASHGFGMASSFRHITSGQSSLANVYDDEEGSWSYDPDEQRWRTVSDAEISVAEEDQYEKAMAMLEVSNMDTKATKFKADEFAMKDEYYTISHDGDFKSYATLQDLEAELVWRAGLHSDDDHFAADGLSRWVEYYIDLGSFDISGNSLISWVDEPDEIWYHENPQNEGLGYIRDGVSILKASAGA